jgi:phosphoglycolate phosphatase
MNIFFDLDGTLIDSRPRMYQLFRALVPESTLSFDAYWILKRKGISHREILTGQYSYSDIHYKNFEQAWMEKIELPQWLALDRPFDGITPFLSGIKEKHKLYIVTARQSTQEARAQINSFGWLGLFDSILVTENKQEKYVLIQESVQTNTFDWLVGDTGKDIATGKKLGMRTAAVLTGFLNRERLVMYNPDLIVDHALDLKF